VERAIPDNYFRYPETGAIQAVMRALAWLRVQRDAVSSDNDAFAVGLTCGGILDPFVEKVSQQTSRARRSQPTRPDRYAHGHLLLTHDLKVDVTLRRLNCASWVSASLSFSLIRDRSAGFIIIGCRARNRRLAV
jgi:hypothetical protein